MFNSTVLQYREIKYILCTLVARIFKPNKTGVVHNAAYIYYIFIVVDQHNGLKFHNVWNPQESPPQQFYWSLLTFALQLVKCIFNVN